MQLWEKLSSDTLVQPLTRRLDSLEDQVRLVTIKLWFWLLQRVRPTTNLIPISGFLHSQVTSFSSSAPSPHHFCRSLQVSKKSDLFLSTDKTMKLDSYLNTAHSKGIKYLKLRLETIKLLEEKTGKKFLDMGLGNDFLFDMTPKAQQK